MRSIAIMFSAFCILGMVGGGAWAWNYSLLDLLLAPGAANVQVMHTGIGEQVVVYRTAGEHDAWHVAVERNLQQHGWTNPPWWRPDMPVVSYTYGSRVGIGLVWTQVDLGGEPHIASIKVRRWLDIPWWQYWPWARHDRAGA
jgi:hypothetical protein